MSKQPDGRLNTTARKTVVWSESDPTVLKTVTLILEDHDITVLGTTDPAEAAALVERPEVCLYVTNPKTGEELAERIKADPQRRKLPILLCTAFTGYDENRLKSSPFDRLLRKPFRQEELLEVIESMTTES